MKSWRPIYPKASILRWKSRHVHGCLYHAKMMSPHVVLLPCHVQRAALREAGEKKFAEWKASRRPAGPSMTSSPANSSCHAAGGRSSPLSSPSPLNGSNHVLEGLHTPSNYDHNHMTSPSMPSMSGAAAGHLADQSMVDMLLMQVLYVTCISETYR